MDSVPWQVFQAILDYEHETNRSDVAQMAAEISHVFNVQTYGGASLICNVVEFTIGLLASRPIEEAEDF